MSWSSGDELIVTQAVDRMFAALETAEEGEILKGILVRANLLKICTSCQAHHRQGNLLCMKCTAIAIRAEQS